MSTPPGAALRAFASTVAKRATPPKSGVFGLALTSFDSPSLWWRIVSVNDPLPSASDEPATPAARQPTAIHRVPLRCFCMS